MKDNEYGFLPRFLRFFCKFLGNSDITTWFPAWTIEQKHLIDACIEPSFASRKYAEDRPHRWHSKTTNRVFRTIVRSVFLFGTSTQTHCCQFFNNPPFDPDDVATLEVCNTTPIRSALSAGFRLGCSICCLILATIILAALIYQSSNWRG